MAKTKTYTIYTGGEKFEVVKIGNENFNVANFNEIISDANEELTEISNMTVSWSSSNMVINFTPITDTKILNAVDNGSLIIRAQLLVHAGTLRTYGVKGTAVDNKLRGKSYGLWPTTAWTDDERRDAIQETFHSNYRQYWKRVKSHYPAYYGRSWVNLTKAQLQAGQVTLTDVVRVLVAAPNSQAPNYVKNQRLQTRNYPDTGSGRYYDYAALLYVPALGPGTSHTFQYHDQGYYRVSDNTLVYNQSSIS